MPSLLAFCQMESSASLQPIMMIEKTAEIGAAGESAMFNGGSSALQLAIFFGLTALIAVLTYWKVHGQGKSQASEGGTTREVFLAGGGLTWLFVAGSKIGRAHV